MTPEEKNQRILKRKREELLKRANATPTASPTQEERLVSDGMKENLKAASHWAGVISKRTAELTQKGVAAAAEKAKEAKAQLDAKRAREAQEHRAVEEKPQDAPLTLEEEMLVRQLTSDAAAPVLVGAGDKGMCTVWELVDEFGEPGAQVADGLGGPSVDAKALSNEDTAALVKLSQQDAVEVLSVSAGPEGSNRPPEAASPEQPVTPTQPPLSFALGLDRCGGGGIGRGGDLLLAWEEQPSASKHTGSHGTGCHSSRSRAVARGGGSPRGCACSSSAFRTGQARSHDRETRTCRRSPGIDDSANCAPANAFAETCNRPIAEEAPRTRRRTAERLAAKSQCRPRRLGEEVGDRLIPLAHPRIRSRKK